MINLKKTFLYLFLFSILLIQTGCKKENLDFGSDDYFGIKAVLKSDNCDADCGEIADCEGQQIKVKGKLDSSNINESDNQFYLIDEGNDDFRLEIKVDDLVNSDVFLKLNGNGENVFRVEGEMEGYDAPINATCNHYDETIAASINIHSLVYIIHIFYITISGCQFNECWNNGTLDQNECVCKCEGLWGGEMCKG